MFFSLLWWIPFLVTGESLWDTGFQGYLTPGTTVQQGDILIVSVDTSFSLSHVATQQDAKTIMFEYSGGEFSDLFSFIPNVKTGVDNSIKGNEGYSLKTDMVVSVVSVENGYAYIKGSREVAIDGKSESITISGYINIKDIDRQRRIPFSQVADSRLVFQTFLYPSQYVLNEEDIEEIMEEIASGEPVTGEEAITESVTPDTEGGSASESVLSGEEPESEETMRRELSLTKEKKMELFLIYINRMIDLLFK